MTITLEKLVESFTSNRDIIIQDKNLRILSAHKRDDFLKSIFYKIYKHIEVQSYYRIENTIIINI